jgi:AbrB family looped-hinge helix DNA binding protein
MRDTSTVTVGPKGRVVIPSEIRRRLDLHEGTELVATVQEDAVVVVPRSSVKRRLRGMFKGVGTSMRDELLAERRAAAERESAP